MLTRQWISAAVVAGWMTMSTARAVQNQDVLSFSRTKIIIEYNASAEDVGVQVLLDGEPWRSVKIFSPGGREILDITSQRSLTAQGLTELFFESSEPSLDEVPLEEFLDRFPEGEYELEGTTVDGIKLHGMAMLSHDIPAGPEILAPVSAGAVPPVESPSNLMIMWESVTESISGSEVDIVGYEVIVEQVDPLRVFSMRLPASVTSLMVPAEFFEQSNTLHKFEVLAIEASGNQTISEGSFVTRASRRMR